MAQEFDSTKHTHNVSPMAAHQQQLFMPVARSTSTLIDPGKLNIDAPHVSLALPQAFESMRASSKRLLGGEPEEKSTLQEMEEAMCSVCPSLSWRNRLIGYGATLACGFCLSFGSLFRSQFVCSLLRIAACERCGTKFGGPSASAVFDGSEI